MEFQYRDLSIYVIQFSVQRTPIYICFYCKFYSIYCIRDWISFDNVVQHLLVSIRLVELALIYYMIYVEFARENLNFFLNLPIVSCLFDTPQLDATTQVK